MLLHSVRHDWPEKAGFIMSRPRGHTHYTFLHFSTSVHFFLNGEEIDARPGACIFYAPGVPQSFRSSQDLIHNWLHAEPKFGYLLKKYGIPENQLLYPGDTAFLSELFRRMEVEHFTESPYKEELLQGYLQEFVIRFARSLQMQEPYVVVPRYMWDRLREIRRTVLSQPEKRWTVAEMAAMASLSPSRFHTVYKANFATSPMQDVIEAKMKYARSLLLSDDRLTISAVAEKLGYQNEYHFLRQFKAAAGVTPGAFRKSKEASCNTAAGGL